MRQTDCRQGSISISLFKNHANGFVVFVAVAAVDLYLFVLVICVCFFPSFVLTRDVAQLIERRNSNPKILGSIP